MNRLQPFNHDWHDKTVAIIASGPSLYEFTDPDLLRERDDCKVISVNASVPWGDIIYGSDGRWWHEWLKSNAVMVGGPECWTQSIGSPGWAEEAYREGLKVIRGVRDNQLSDNRSMIYTGNNSAFAALNLAVLSGSKRIMLLGVDLCHYKRKSHWFGDHPPKLQAKSPYYRFAKAFRAVAPELKDRHIEAINCSPISKLECFPKMALEECLR